MPVPDDLNLRFRSLPTQDVGLRATTPLRTVIDCARGLELPEAPAVADSALRSGAVTPHDLAGAALPRTGRDAARRVLDAASAQPVNAFESGLRGLAMEARSRQDLLQSATRVRSPEEGDGRVDDR